MTVAAEQGDLLDAWRLGPLLAAITPTTGTLNHTLLLTAATGDYVLRAYRHREREPVAREHAAIAHVRAHGLPAVAPIPLPGGESVLERDGRFYALFPRAAGRQLRRRDLGKGELAAMGTFLATLQRALGSFPRAQAARRSFAVDRAATLVGIERLEAIIRARDPEGTGDDPTAAVVLARLAGRRAWIERYPATAQVDLTPLEHQVIHGDYQETNLFFESGRVRAIIDWDQTYLAPRAWEVARTLDLVCSFAPDPCRLFLGAYRAELPLPLSDLDLAVACYGLLRAHDLWLYEELYLRGNDRVRRFIRPGGFVPIAEQWARLRPSLSL